MSRETLVEECEAPKQTERDLIEYGKVKENIERARREGFTIERERGYCDVP